MMKKYFSFNCLLLAVLFLSLSTLSFAVSFDNSEGQLKTVLVVDHKQHTLTIDDKLYAMPLGFKVYKMDRHIRPFRKVNRYAIKEGQSVSINERYESGITYVEELLIVE